MIIPALFFICLAVTVIGIIIAYINFGTAVQRSFQTGEVKGIIITHLVAMAMYVLGGIGSIGFGIAWIVTYLKH